MVLTDGAPSFLTRLVCSQYNQRLERLLMNLELMKAQEIVNREEPPRGHAPKGSFHSAERVDYKFFESKSEEIRENILKNSMPFLHTLIYRKINSAVIERDKMRAGREKKKADATDLPADEDRILEVIPAELMEGLSHSERPSSSRTDEHRLKHVRTLISDCFFEK